jgi:hypothetical protein
MSRAGALVAGLVAALALAGCQTWVDRADAEMLAECAKIAEPEARDRCQTEVMTVAADAERAFQEKQREAAEAREQREALREAYGVPKRAAWP